MIDPKGAVSNFARLEEMGARGRYGFYEALDFNEVRRPSGEVVAIVRNFMAHHQGMTIVAIANVLHGGQMRERFHREPMIRATELLLQERMPRDVAAVHPHAEEVKAGRPSMHAATSRRFGGTSSPWRVRRSHT
jgi:cyclic beta-1,2-glucan synthetase